MSLQTGLFANKAEESQLVTSLLAALGPLNTESGLNVERPASDETVECGIASVATEENIRLESSQGATKHAGMPRQT